MMKLNWPKAFVISSIILAVAFVASTFSPAISQNRGASYMVASSGGTFVWRVNVVTGAVSYCVRRDDSTDKDFTANRPPYCSAESTPVQ